MKKRASVLVGVVLSIMLSGTLALGIATAGGDTFPDVIPLPDGWQPEGIAVGNGDDFYVGSLATGAIYRGDLHTGNGAVLVPPQEGRVAVGLGLGDGARHIFAAGGRLGAGFVYDATTGEAVAEYQFSDPTSGTFVNDVVVTRDAAYFTDSFRPVLYRVPLNPDGSPTSSFDEIALGGDFVPVPGFNTNGIDATADGKQLVVVNSTSGAVYTVDPNTGVASEIDLGGSSVPTGDGILLDGRTLYVVQNRMNQIAVIDLNAGLTTGQIVHIITDSDFRVPTTIAEFGSSLYAVNARFGDVPPPGESLEYEVVKVSKP